ncbi:hypothetical protein KI387_035665, partial [Taxus chinensis]
MVSRMPQVPPPNDAVGIDDQIAKVVQLLDWEDAKPIIAVVIYGLGGSGKTTLGQAVYASLKDKLQLGWRHSQVTLVQNLETRDSQNNGRFRQDGLLWFKDIVGRHDAGEFSMAVVQENQLLEDQSQLESGPLTSTEDLHQSNWGCHVIRKAFLATEEGVLSVVTKAWPTKPQTVAVGSCCLVGVVCSGILYVANLGDSRVVMGKLVKATGEVITMQLSIEYNAGIENIRQELQSLHPYDSHIVVLKHGVWWVKGIIQIRTLRVVLASQISSCMAGLATAPNKCK